MTSQPTKRMVLVITNWDSNDPSNYRETELRRTDKDWAYTADGIFSRAFVVGIEHKEEVLSILERRAQLKKAFEDSMGLTPLSSQPHDLQPNHEACLLQTLLRFAIFSRYARPPGRLVGIRRANH